MLAETSFWKGIIMNTWIYWGDKSILDLQLGLGLKTGSRLQKYTPKMFGPQIIFDS